MTKRMLSKYFSFDELVCPCGCGRADMSPAFLEKADRLRELYGKPITIVRGGGYRCPKYNAKVGGAPSSYHPQGRAFDPLVPSDRDRFLLLRIGVSIFGGIGINNGSLHFDDRPMPGAAWTYYK